MWDVGEAGAPPDGYPTADAGNLYCDDGGAKYSFQACHPANMSVCSSLMLCDMVQEVSLGGAPKPDGWPCP